MPCLLLEARWPTNSESALNFDYLLLMFIIEEEYSR